VLLVLAFPETTNTAGQRSTTTDQDGGSDRSESGSLPVLVDQGWECHHLFAFEEPLDIGVERIGDGLPQRVSGFTSSIHDAAEIGLMDANHLGEPVLAYSSLVDRELQIWVNRSLIEFHFLLASL
jgi:hypothetical protein